MALRWLESKSPPCLLAGFRKKESEITRMFYCWALSNAVFSHLYVLNHSEKNEKYGF